MKTAGVILVTFLCLFFTAALSAGEQIEELFKSKGCTLCHKQEGTSSSFPSLIEIAMVYKGKQKQLIQYLNGEADPVIKPESAGTMKRQIEKTKAMSNPDRTALADFMLSH